MSITIPQRQIIKDCWSRSFSYDEYLQYCQEASEPPVEEKTYLEMYNEYEKEMKEYFLNQNRQL